MPYSKGSKPLKKTDESAKRFIMEVLGEDNFPCVDIDMTYNYKGTRCIFEFLKCEKPSSYLHPYNSHPHRYPRNYRKFKSLVNLKDEFKNARLFLINYTDKDVYIKEAEDTAKNLVLIMEVEGYNAKAIEKWRRNGEKGSCNFLKITNVAYLTRETFKKKLMDLNPDKFFK